MRLKPQGARKKEPRGTREQQVLCPSVPTAPTSRLVFCGFATGAGQGVGVNQAEMEGHRQNLLLRLLKSDRHLEREVDDQVERKRSGEGGGGWVGVGCVLGLGFS